MAVIQEKLTIDSKSKKANMSLLIAHFIDNGHHVAFVPSLNLSAYGPSRKEADKMLIEAVVTDYFENLFLLSESKITKELSRFGWERSKVIRKRFTNTPHVDSKGILQNFNLPVGTEISLDMIGEISAAA